MQLEKNQALISAPFGGVLLTFKGPSLIKADLLEEPCETHYGRFQKNRAVVRLEAYLRGEIDALQRWPYFKVGTPYQLLIWKRATQIKPGKIRTYAQIAFELQTGAMAVGGACRDNPIPIFVPTHRIVSSLKASGCVDHRDCTPIKLWLLEHEKKYCGALDE